MQLFQTHLCGAGSSGATTAGWSELLDPLLHVTIAATAVVGSLLVSAVLLAFAHVGNLVKVFAHSFFDL